MIKTIDSSFVNSAFCRAVAWGCFGYVIGKVANTQPNACAITLIISSLAKTIFSVLFSYIPAKSVQYEVLCSASTFLTDLVTVVFLKHKKLISSEGTDVLLGAFCLKAFILG